MPTKPKRTRRSARTGRDAELIPLLRELIGTFRELIAATNRLEQQITRSTERFAAMRRG